ncbi:MAG: hypothetical protein ACM3NV_11130 [Syntrophothermus sp.]
MSAASTAAAAEDRGPGLRARIAAVAVVVALGALAAYAMFSGPTKVAVPAAGPAAPAAGKAAPAGEEQLPEREGEGGR